MPQTLVFLHAHPDDEAMLTAGTMARATAEGNRVVLVTATDGAAGLADPSLQAAGLGRIRAHELELSARILGVARLVELGYHDSGLHGDEPDPHTLCNTPLAQFAGRVAGVLAEESADVLVTYDSSGGYGHPDHKRVHTAGLMAAARTGSVRVYAATAPRWPFAVGVRAAGKVMTFPPDFDPGQFERAFTPTRQITDRIDVRDYADFKRAAMHAHASQATGGDVRTLAAFLRLPRPLYRVLLGTEFFRRLQ